MYQVIGISVSVTIFYLISLFFCRSGLYSQAVHRKIWNIILAISFLFTALAGIFLALQVSYKWDIPFIKAFLKWHVEIGIIFTITGIMHLTWHLSYFRNILAVTAGKNHIKPTKTEDHSSSLPYNLFMAGLTGSAVQLILIREMMNISGGNELNTGIFLASWLMVSAAGAAMAARNDSTGLKQLNLIFSLSPILSVFLLLLFARLFLEPGESPAILATMVMTIGVLFPICFISGFLFVRLSGEAIKTRGLRPGISYAIETSGCISGGILVVILGNGILNNYQIFLLITLFTIIYTLNEYYYKTKRISYILRIIASVMAVFIIAGEPDVFFRQLLLPVARVDKTYDTPFGNITEGTYGGERSIYYDHRLEAYKSDIAESEENVHYALLQLHSPEKIIIISGRLSSIMPELKKYDLQKIIQIERDPALSLTDKYETTTPKPLIIRENRDAFSFIRNTSEKTDAVIMLLPPPSTLSLNRYYTTTFFSYIKDILKPGGVFLCSPGKEVNYMNAETINLYSSVYVSLKKVFANVKPMPGNKLFFIASDGPVSVEVCRMASEKNIKNTYVSSDFLSDDILLARSSEIEKELDGNNTENSILKPISCFHFQAFNLSRSLNEKIPALVVILILFAAPVLLTGRKNLMMYSSAASLAGFEIVTLFLIQTVTGNMYLVSGLVISVFMTGLALGSLTGSRLKFPGFLPSSLLFIFYLLIAFAMDMLLMSKNNLFSLSVILILSVIPSFFTGMNYGRLTRFDKDGTTTSGLYSSDLAGSAFGFIIVSGLMVPLIGLKVSMIFLSLIIFAGILFGSERNKW